MYKKEYYRKEKDEAKKVKLVYKPGSVIDSHSSMNFVTKIL